VKAIFCIPATFTIAPCGARLPLRPTTPPVGDSGFFVDVRMKVLDSPGNQNGQIVAFSLRDKPIIRRIVYKDIKSIPESDITSAFSNEKVGLSVGTWFDQNELAHGAAVIKELLVARGWPSATVMPTSETNFSTNVVTVQFEVNEGPKSR